MYAYAEENYELHMNDEYMSSVTCQLSESAPFVAIPVIFATLRGLALRSNVL